MPKPKVIQWATGYTGRYSLGYILDNRVLELVGVRCYSPDKVGVDAGELIDRAPYGVALNNDRDALLSVDADSTSSSEVFLTVCGHTGTRQP